MTDNTNHEIIELLSKLIAETRSELFNPASAPIRGLLKQYENSIQKVISSLKTRHDNERKEVLDSRYRINALERENARFQALIQKKDRTIEELKGAIDNSKSINEEYLREVTRLREEVERVETSANEKSGFLVKLRSQIAARQNAIDKESDELNALKVALQKEKDELDRRAIDLDLKANQEFAKNIQKTANTYVDTLLTSLENKVTEFKAAAAVWAICGALLVSLTMIAMFSSWSHTDLFKSMLQWENVALSAARGAILLGIMTYGTRYCSIRASENFRQSIRISSTIHRISFGNFYIKTYGEKADWEKVKDAFATWHMEDETTDKSKEPTSKIGNDINFSAEKVSSLISDIANSITAFVKK